jgi:hypothetical protein
MGANAQTTVPTFTAAQVLTADQMNQSARTGVPVFSDTTARDAGFGGSGEKTLAEGQLCYLESTNVVQYYDGAAWATVGPSTSGARQVVSTLKTDSFSTTSTTFVDVTGVSVTITPSSASSTVLVIVSGVNGSNGVDNFTPINLVRGSTAIAQSTGNANFAATLNLINQSTGITLPFSIVFLDSPATTSATTYKIQMRSNNNPLAYIGRQATSDNRSVTTITAIEFAP